MPGLTLLLKLLVSLNSFDTLNWSVNRVSSAMNDFMMRKFIFLPFEEGILLSFCSLRLLFVLLLCCFSFYTLSSHVVFCFFLCGELT